MKIKDILKFLFLDLLKKYKKLFILLVFGLIIVAVLSIFPPKLMGNIVDQIIENKKDKFCNTVVLLVLIYISRYILAVIVKRRFSVLNQDISEALQKRMIRKIMRIEMEYYDMNDKGYVLSRFNEASAVASIFSPNIVNIFLGFLDIVVAAITMMTISIYMSLLVFLVCPIFYFVINYSTRHMKEYTRKCAELGGVLNAEAYEILNHVDEVKISNDYEKQINNITKPLSKLKKALIKQNKSMIYFIENTQLLSSIASLLVLMVSALLIFNGKFTLGLYTAFAAYSNRVFSNVQSIASIGVTLNPIIVSMERVYEFLNIKEENVGTNRLSVDDISEIELKNVTFSYPSKQNAPVLSKYNIRWKKGDKLWINGKNGTGKSTIIKLLLGLYNTVDGEVLVNNTPMEKLDITSLRGELSVVSQNPILFRGTVEDNILVSNEMKQNEKLKQLVDKYNLEENLTSFSDGLQTVVAFGGANLSGGQRQFIAFMRAIISEKPLLILDEPTASIDINLKEKMVDILVNDTNANMILLISHDNYLITSKLHSIFKIVSMEACNEGSN